MPAIQKYRKAWEAIPQLQGWLCEVPNDPIRAYCNVCKIELQAHKSSLLEHKKSAKHVFGEMSQDNQQYNNEITVENSNVIDIYPSSSHCDFEENQTLLAKNKNELRVPRTSFIWHFFTKKNKNESVCNICLKTYKTSGNTSNLRKHIEFNHEEAYKILLNSPKESFNMWIAEQKRRGWNKHEHDLDIFGKCIAAQMKKLPEEQAIKLTIDIQTMIGQARLEELQEQRMLTANGNIKGEDFRVQYMDGGQIVIVSNP